jgi:cytosine/adenosine deaminase-related metal-dependent hydrolase
VAIAGDQAHALEIAPGQDAEAVVLDLVQPIETARRGLGR